MIVIKPSNTTVVKEAYFGKSPILQQAEQVLGQLVDEMRKDPYADYTNHKLNKVFESLIKKQFGWKDFYMVWIKTPASIPNAYSLFSSDIIYNGKYISTVDKKKGFYDKKHSHVAHVTGSTTMIRDIDLTTGELMAILLHEFGHNFDISPYYKLHIIYKMAEQITKILTAPSSFKALKELTETNPEMNPYTPYIKTGLNVYNALVNLISTTGFGKKMFHVYDRFTSFLSAKVPGVKEFMQLYNKIIDIVVRAKEYAKVPSTIMNAPYHIILSPWFHLLGTFERKGETFADSFATAYGYGPELAVALGKLDTNILGGSLKNASGIRKVLIDIRLAQRAYLNFIMGSDHGTHDTRMHNIMKQLEVEINDPEIPAGLKKELMQQVKETKVAYDRFLNAEFEGVRLSITATVRGGINKIFNGESDFIAQLFPENVVNTRFKEDVSEYLVDLSLCGLMYTNSYVEACNENNLDRIALYENKVKFVNEQVKLAERVMLEVANIDKDIAPIIEELNKKGYITKYSSAGHPNLRKKEDNFRDGVYRGKLYSDARIQFDGNFNFPKAPKYWIWKNVEGDDYLDVDPKQYTPEKTGMTPNEEFNRWKAAYMGTLKTWVENLPDESKTDDSTEVKDTKGRNIAVENTEDIITVDDMYNDILESVLFDVSF